MRIHLILDLTPEGPRRDREVVTEQLEAEVEQNGLEVDGTVYEITVLGSGATAAAATLSMKMRRAGAKQS
jgi:hypothetical protein